MQAHERAAQIWPVLSFAAKNRQILTYDIVGNLIGVPRFALSQLLGVCRNLEFVYIYFHDSRHSLIVLN